MPTSVEIYSKSPLGVVLPPSQEVYFWYGAFASGASIAVCPSDQPPAIEPHHAGGPKTKLSGETTAALKDFPLPLLVGPMLFFACIERP